MTVYLDSSSLRSFSAERDPTIDDFSVVVSGGFTVIPEVGNFWKNTTNSSLWQCVSIVPDTSIVWRKISNINVSTFVPELEIEGLRTGISYRSREGKIALIGNDLVFLNVFVYLQSKGSQVGNIRIQGLPFTASATNAVQPLTIDHSNISLASSNRKITAEIKSNRGVIEINKNSLDGSVTPSPLTDAEITNDTQLRISGYYFI